MKRYTLKFTAAGGVADDDLKAAVEDTLQRLHPGLTYRVGRAGRTDPQSISVEIASEGKKEALLPHLKRIEPKLPVTLDRIDWGWDSGDASLAPSLIRNPDLPPDPLASTPAPVGPAVFPPAGKMFWLRYIGFLLLTLALGISFYFKFSNANSPVWDGVFLALYFFWLFSLNGIQLNPWRLARKIDCGETGIEVSYWFRGTPARLRWADIRGMDLTYTTCIIRGNSSPIKFAINENFGFKEKNVILKTIAERASLRFVEGPIYRRAEAP
ncbi:MAG: hypothetical protein WBM17_16755 [Anaerolineales bacterium]